MASWGDSIVGSRRTDKHTASTQRIWRRRIVVTALSLLIPFVILLGACMILEESFIFFPSRYPAGEWAPPNLDFEDVYFESADGTQLHAWYVPHDRPRAVILFSHGNGGNLSHRADTARILNELVGVSVMLYDYRGYGRSEGRPNEQGIMEDARAAREWLAQRERIAPEDIVLVGRSLGGAVAVDLAQDGARGLILESTFTSIPDMASVHYPWLPFRRLIRNRFDSAQKIGNYHGPLLQSHGKADRIVPFEIGQRLHEAASAPKQFLVIKDGDHNDPQPIEFYDAMIDFLDNLPSNQEPVEE